MLDLPSLPTDSLYKFIALAGIFLSAMSTYIFLKSQILLKEKIFELQLDVSNTTSEITYLEKQESPSREDVLKVRIKTNTCESKLKSLEFLSNQRLFIIIFCSLFFLIGTSMTYQGFNLWYHKIQVHQDKLIELQVKKNSEKQL